MKELIGTPSIHPLLFYSGKISGYITWIIIISSMLGFSVIKEDMKGLNIALSKIIFFIGIFIAVFSLINLGSSTRLGLPTDDTILKTTGLYKISRNPMYFGFNLMTIASMIYTLDIIIVLLGIFSILTYHFIILREEKYLVNYFESEYLEYKKKVRRYI